MMVSMRDPRQGPFRGGFIGFYSDSHWAAIAHVPGLKSLGDKLIVTGVANNSPGRRRRTGEALGLPYAFASVDELIHSPARAIVMSALLFSKTLAFFCMPLALKNTEAATVSIFMNLQPLVTSAVAIGIGQDAFSWRKGLAAMLVLSGAYLVSVKRQPKLCNTPQSFNPGKRIWKHEC